MHRSPPTTTAPARGRCPVWAADIVPGVAAAWTALSQSSTPMLVAFSDSDPITAPMAAIFQSQMRGAHGVEHPVIQGAGHFLQEDAGEVLANHIVDFLAA